MRTQDGKPIVAISNGDPSGIGPEIALKAMASEEVRRAAAPIIVGSPEVYERDLKLAGAPLEIRLLASPSEATGAPGTVEILPFDRLDLSQCPRGEVSAEAGRYSGASIAHAISLGMAGEAHAVVVSPNNKRAMKDGGHEHTGFEEISRHYTGAGRSIQILMGRKYNLARVTNHVPLRQVADICTRERVLTQIRVLKDSLAMVGLPDPVIGVSGLNPHNGEHGLMGTEEMTDIGPACDDARAEGIKVIGPIPADTVFVDIDKLGLDIVLSMYHDHGNSGIKILEFGHLVNFIGGLPIPVFTVSHGTAFDIAGKGIAGSTNMELSIIAAAKSMRAL
ncbi:4-hydroxythreonine-4-phosphate dehydrogenase [Ancylobacter novellus DSM 506]|uniref:4-hydroxythreonine-4-phosphate dehydrogenase n=1 Tax=Ancylobacter novellus (strain ATCC 8093 / DSM 506 / JCM 20403 / CCM 1077 / IAM 12100 / NBRC 12443 / NCIMB 10456) TaxID=639283 RepID=D7AA65_ANCN5|nr:4-hydroxythreonine-4-phosphate dehydrogenase PdxA [Ancylobacter novellus]ADH90852.1 4-hydroxythreonine-4-phosphate dehydrogenase [Ancylobacter novellus DSM 506]